MDVSRYDKLSESSGRCFFMDTYRDNGAYNFHPREPVPCGFLSAVYVRCRDFILHSYQKFLILLCCLFFCFPAYAEEVNTGYQNGTDAWDTAQSSKQEFVITGVEYIRRDNGSLGIKIYFNGDWPFLEEGGLDNENNYFGLRYRSEEDGKEYSILSRNVDYILPSPTSATNIRTPLTILYWQSAVRENNVTTQSNIVSYSFNGTHVSDNSIGNSSGIIGLGADYLNNVRLVFSWILSHITELITFILGNAFLAVGLSLFLAGSVIAFFVRVKRS